MIGDDTEIIYEGLLREVSAIIMLLLIGIRVLYKIQQYGFLFTSESEISLYYRPEEYWSPYW